MKKSTKIIFLALLPFFASCGSSNDAMDTDGALDIIATYVASIDTTQYKIYELNWYDDNGNNVSHQQTPYRKPPPKKSVKHLTFSEVSPKKRQRAQTF